MGDRPMMNDATSAPTATDLPLGGLPSADTTMLTFAQLEVAIIEVRFTTTAAAVPASMVPAVRDALANATEVDFPAIQPATQSNMQIDFNSSGPSLSGNNVQGWQIASSDGHHSATIFPSSVIWQVGDYKRWSTSMRQPIEVLLAAVEPTLAPVLVQRIGLRYVNRFTDPSCIRAEDWFGKLDDSLLGPLSNHIFGRLIRGAQQQVDISLDGQHGATLRHGPISDQNSKSVNYLLDLDVFANATNTFDPDRIIDSANALNRTALSLFQACLSAEFLGSLRGEGLSDVVDS